MIWFFLLIVLFAFLMGLFQIPIWIMYCVLLAVLVFIMFRNPLLFGKDAEKMMAYFKKKEEAVALLGNMIPQLRGYKLLTAVQYRKQLLEGRV
jgi:hypothetical protein